MTFSIRGLIEAFSELLDNGYRTITYDEAVAIIEHFAKKAGKARNG